MWHCGTVTLVDVGPSLKMALLFIVIRPPKWSALSSFNYTTLPETQESVSAF